MPAAISGLLQRMRLPNGRPGRPKEILIILLACLIVGGLAVAAEVQSRPGSQTVTMYACVRDNRLVWVGDREPRRCPPGSNLIRDNDVEIVDPDHSIGHRLTILLRNWLSIPGVMAVLVIASLFWVLDGLRLGGWLRVRWLLVPILAFLAAACVAGPGHWFAKEPWEGPSIVSLGSRDAITLLDLVGLTIAMLAIALAIWLAARRWGSHPR